MLCRRPDHLTVYGGFPALLVNASQNIGVTHSAFRGLAAPWTGRAHMKYRGTASYQIVLRNSQPVNENLEFAYCEFTGDHDFAFPRYAKNLRFHHNFVDNFNDDGLECGAKLRWHTFYIHHNRIGACLGVLQQHEIDKDESPMTHDPASGVCIYRHIFDQRAGVYYSLPDEPDPSGAFLHHEGHLLSDHGSPVYPVMRVYDAGLIIPAEWPDPLREGDSGKPDIGAVPLGVSGWRVGVEGRIPVFGGTTEAAQ